ncbi:MAG TPA: L-histidine N(alpha)-methyltransferase [candidate division Zixibacteria bacterium]|nr:L-histidine N(alpha)-methyltransferase [candidate division Zixibacteria bacterium]
MSAQPSYRILQSADYADSFRAEDAFALDVLVGLSAERKEISSKYLYDEKGSELFRRITELPEYYLTNCELEIIRNHADDVAEHLDHDSPYNIVELGAGAGKKTLTLLKRLMERKLDLRYVPIDVSEGAMRLLVGSLSTQFPTLQVDGLVTDYFNGLKWMNGQAERKNLVLFMGSSIGNFTHAENCVLLRSLWNCLSHDDLLLIGFDLRKDIDLLLRAYNDSDGVTREFNLNLLRRINRELGGNFDLDKWRHYGTYDVFSGGMESYLVSSEKQSVLIERIGRRFSFEGWEPIHTENSYKYLISDIEDLAGETGFQVCEHFKDSRHYFADSVWKVNKPEAQ